MTMTERPAPGAYRDVPFEDYLAWDAVDASFLRAMDHTPAYARWKRDNPQQDKAHYAKGRLFHCLSLEPHKAEQEFAVKPETYQAADGTTKKFNANSKTCKAWLAEQAGRTTVDVDTWREAMAMAQRVRAMPQMAPFLADADVELSVVWLDKATGLRCKARFDACKNGIVIDLKSTSAAARHECFFREAHQYRYHLQAAHYIEALKAAGLARGTPWFAFVVVEAYPPHDLCMYDCQDDRDALSLEFLEYGRLKRTILMARAKECADTGRWPGYPPESMDMSLTYQARQELEELAGGLQ